MATQGIVTLTGPFHETLVKLITGQDGQFAEQIARAIFERQLEDAEAVYELATEIGLGGSSLVVMDKDVVWYEDQSMPFAKAADDFDLDDRYFATFTKPEFNPRWHHGTADHVWIVDIGDNRVYDFHRETDRYKFPGPDGPESRMVSGPPGSRTLRVVADVVAGVDKFCNFGHREADRAFYEFALTTFCRNTHIGRIEFTSTHHLLLGEAEYLHPNGAGVSFRVNGKQYNT